jgi:tetratricopeptide (TPR) repeat protein
LAQTPFLQVLAPDKVRETMKQLNHPEDAKVTPAIGLEVCRKTNSRALVTSSIGDMGNHFRIVLNAINCESGTTFARSEQEAPRRNDIVHVLGTAGAQLRRGMGEPSESLNKFNKPLELATSPSPEALQFLAQAFRRHFSTDLAGTISLYERAIDLDPSLALAYASAGIVYLSAGNTARTIADEKKAYELRDRLTGQLRFLAETLYFDLGLGDLEKSYPVYQEWVQTFPLDGVAHNNFGANLLNQGQYDRAAAEAREALRLMPVLGMGSYYPLMAATTYGNRLDEAKLIFAQAQSRKADIPSMHELLHLIAFLQHDEPAMKEQLAWLRRANESGVAGMREADVQFYYGRFREARRILQQVKVPDTDKLGHLPYFGDDIAMQELEAGDTAGAQRIVGDSATRQQDRRLQLNLALTSARTGDVAEAENLVQKIDRESPHDTLVQYCYLPTIRAAIKLFENDPASAIEVLQPAEKYALVSPQQYVGAVYSAYIRGLAYLKMGEGRPAAVEFQKLLDHQPLVGRFVTGALAHLQLGRAQAMMGDKEAARKSYHDFLDIWKDADPDIPILKQAKSEYAALR